MLPHTGLFLLWKVALQMRIRRRLKTRGAIFAETSAVILAQAGMTDDKSRV